MAREAASCASNASTKAISCSTLPTVRRCSFYIMLNMVSHCILVADAYVPNLLELFEQAGGIGVGGVLA